MVQLPDASVIIGKNITIIASMESYYATSSSSMSQRVLYENRQVCKPVHAKYIAMVIVFVYTGTVL